MEYRAWLALLDSNEATAACWEVVFPLVRTLAAIALSEADDVFVEVLALLPQLLDEGDEVFVLLLLPHPLEDGADDFELLLPQLLDEGADDFELPQLLPP